MKLLITALALAALIAATQSAVAAPAIAATWVNRDKAMTAPITGTP